MFVFSVFVLRLAFLLLFRLPFSFSFCWGACSTWHFEAAQVYAAAWLDHHLLRAEHAALLVAFCNFDLDGGGPLLLPVVLFFYPLLLFRPHVIIICRQRQIFFCAWIYFVAAGIYLEAPRLI